MSAQLRPDVSFFFFNILDPELMEPTDVELKDAEGKCIQNAVLLTPLSLLLSKARL